eukprot:1151422-Prorocentrum_lima.AAC.1
MTSSLVGSEMCIRDSFKHLHQTVPLPVRDAGEFAELQLLQLGSDVLTIVPVSYTHLTLPTICSV